MDLAELERLNFSCELHDGILQQIVGAKMHVEAMRHRSQSGISPTVGQLIEVESILHAAMMAGRRWIGALRGEALVESPDLAEAFTSLLQQAEPGSPELILNLEIEQLDKLVLPREVTLNFFRVAQEAVRNAAKHSKSKQIHVSLEIDPSAGALVLEVKDTGCGFSIGRKMDDHFGLSIMRARAKLIHARIEIQSAPRSGTVVSLRWDFNSQGNINTTSQGLPQAEG